MSFLDKTCMSDIRRTIPPCWLDYLAMHLTYDLKCWIANRFIFYRYWRPSFNRNVSNAGFEVENEIPNKWFSMWYLLDFPSPRLIVNSPYTTASDNIHCYMIAIHDSDIVLLFSNRWEWLRYSVFIRVQLRTLWIILYNSHSVPFKKKIHMIGRRGLNEINE